VQGDTAAEVKLGDAYVNGTGVLQSNYLAYVWYGTAVGLGANAAEPKRDKVATMLQPAEVKQANRVIENNLDRIKKHP
jgi:TPR repeat protein